MDHVLTGPLSRKITSEDRQGIDALFNAVDDAWGQRDLQALTTFYDFPIYVGTDDSGGTYQGAEWDADQFRAAMTAALQADGNRVDRRHKRTPHFLSDSTAIGPPSYLDTAILRDSFGRTGISGGFRKVVERRPEARSRARLHRRSGSRSVTRPPVLSARASAASLVSGSCEV